MEFVTLDLEARNSFGKLNRIRNSGYIPGIVYGEGMEPSPVQIKESVFCDNMRHHGINTIYDVHLNDQSMQAVIRDLQVDPLKNTYMHVDLQRVSMDHHRQAHVPIRIVGKSGQQLREGVINQQLDHIDVKGFPADIPEYIELNVSDMKLGEHITVSDLLVPENLLVENDPGEVVISFSPARSVIEDLNTKDETPANAVPIIGNDERETNAT
ncbi:MAG: 50S ribosomal protein L25 [Thermoclostridium sp.]|nr:50S ribosomal protein L25 [Thermoclostridium sp.]